MHEWMLQGDSLTSPYPLPVIFPSVPPQSSKSSPTEHLPLPPINDDTASATPTKISRPPSVATPLALPSQSSPSSPPPSSTTLSHPSTALANFKSDTSDESLVGESLGALTCSLSFSRVELPPLLASLAGAMLDSVKHPWVVDLPSVDKDELNPRACPSAMHMQAQAAEVRALLAHSLARWPSIMSSSLQSEDASEDALPRAPQLPLPVTPHQILIFLLESHAFFREELVALPYPMHTPTFVPSPAIDTLAPARARLQAAAQTHSTQLHADEQSWVSLRPRAVDLFTGRRSAPLASHSLSLSASQRAASASVGEGEMMQMQMQGLSSRPRPPGRRGGRGGRLC